MSLIYCMINIFNFIIKYLVVKLYGDDASYEIVSRLFLRFFKVKLMSKFFFDLAKKDL